MGVRSLVALGALVAAFVVAQGPVMAQSNDGQDRHVKIINETDHTMMHFYASNSAKNSWEEDILGQDILRVGGEVTINIDDGSGHCLYDFKALFDDGTSNVRNSIDVCKVGTYRYAE